MVSAQNIQSPIGQGSRICRFFAFKVDYVLSATLSTTLQKWNVRHPRDDIANDFVTPKAHFPREFGSQMRSVLKVRVIWQKRSEFWFVLSVFLLRKHQKRKTCSCGSQRIQGRETMVQNTKRLQNNKATQPCLSIHLPSPSRSRKASVSHSQGYQSATALKGHPYPSLVCSWGPNKRDACVSRAHMQQSREELSTPAITLWWVCLTRLLV